MESAALSDYAQHALKEICRQEWVREKFLKDPKGLLTEENLLDKILSAKHVSTMALPLCVCVCVCASVCTSLYVHLYVFTNICRKALMQFYVIAEY